MDIRLWDVLGGGTPCMKTQRNNALNTGVFKA